MEKKPFRDLLKMPSPDSRSPPPGQVKKSSPGSRYSAAYEYGSPTEADKREIELTQFGSENNQDYAKKMADAINKADFEKSMASNPYLNKGGHKTRKTRKSRRRKSRRTRKH